MITLTHFSEICSHLHTKKFKKVGNYLLKISFFQIKKKSQLMTVNLGKNREFFYQKNGCIDLVWSKISFWNLTKN